MGALALHRSRAGPPDPEVARQMLEAAPHRGDRRKVEVLGRVAVGICNDPDWVTATLVRRDGHLAAFCGALDNDADLRAELRRAGAREPADGTAAATALAAFEQWGQDAIARFRGSFAGVITDGWRVRCYRDQFGARPLFHHDGRDGFFAATEVKQVLAGCSIPREPDLDHLHGIIFGGLDRSTAYRGVERLPKRSITTAGQEPGIRVCPYWEPGKVVETADLEPEEALEGTLDALSQAVRRVLTGRDVILLSGGLDSPALAAFAVRDGDPARPVQALTAIYPEHPSVDEQEWTQMAADHLRMRLHRFSPDAGSLDAVDRWVNLLDGPIDILSIPEMAQSYEKARALGARTVINGEIAETLFENRAYLLDHYLAHGRLRAAARYLAHLRVKGRGRRQLARDIVLAVAPVPLVAAYVRRQRRHPQWVPEWLDIQRMRDARPHEPTWRLSPRRRWIEMQTSVTRGSGHPFEASEICAAVCGVDSRRPFADVDLWEFILGLPAEVKFPNGRTKPLLRQAMRGLLPDELIDRKDQTVFNEYHLAKADYPGLRRLLVDSPPYLEGVDYRLVRRRVESGDMPVWELQWARDLARVHAFLNRW